MKEDTFVKLFRSVTDNPLFFDPLLLAVWIQIICKIQKVSFTYLYKTYPIELSQGECIFNVYDFAKTRDIPKTNVLRVLDKMKKACLIECRQEDIKKVDRNAVRNAVRNGSRKILIVKVLSADKIFEADRNLDRTADHRTRKNINNKEKESSKAINKVFCMENGNLEEIVEIYSQNTDFLKAKMEKYALSKEEVISLLEDIAFYLSKPPYMKYSNISLAFNTFANRSKKAGKAGGGGFRQSDAQGAKEEALRALKSLNDEF